MSPSAEVWLMLLALALYVYDAALLLQSDELVLVRGDASRWIPRFGANGWKLGGKEPLVPNLLTPWRSLVRIRWNFELGLEKQRTSDGPHLPRIGLVPRLAVVVLMVLIFVAFPICLFVYPVTSVTLSVVAMIYVGCIVVLASLRRDWTSLGLKRPAFWKLCGECITCPPFCINAVRKVSLWAPASVTLADIADDAKQHDELDDLKRQLALRVREQIDVELEGSERMVRLKTVERALSGREES